VRPYPRPNRDDPFNGLDSPVANDGNAAADRWLDLEHIDRYSGTRYRISTTMPADTEDTARVQTYRDV